MVIGLVGARAYRAASRIAGIIAVGDMARGSDGVAMFDEGGPFVLERFADLGEHIKGYGLAGFWRPLKPSLQVLEERGCGCCVVDSFL